MTSVDVVKFVCDIIQTDMGLDDGQVFLKKQKVDLPTATGFLAISIGLILPKVLGSKTEFSPTGGGGQETKSVNMGGTLSIDVMSRDTTAQVRLNEVVMALCSTYSQQVQEANSFKLATRPVAITDLSEIDGAAIPYRYNISVQIQYSDSKQKAVDYYGQFPDEIRTEA